MKYLVLLYDNEAGAHPPGTPEFDAELAAYDAFGDLAGDAVLGGAALHLSDRARTVRHTGGEVTITDGPFAESTEALGGVYFLEADNLDDAIELVRHLPPTASPTGAAEIRPMGNDRLPATDRQLDQYLVTMHGTVDDSSVPGTTAFADRGRAIATWIEEAGPTFVGGASIEPPEAATTVRVRDGEVVLSDGPFSELIEVVGGFFLVRGDLPTIEGRAADIPVPADGGAVEIRPVMDLGEV